MNIQVRLWLLSNEMNFCDKIGYESCLPQELKRSSGSKQKFNQHENTALWLKEQTTVGVIMVANPFIND